MIIRKSSSQIVLMKKACSIVKEALAIAERMSIVGSTTMQINDAVEKFILSQGATPSFKNYQGFPFAICSSVNDEVVHGFPNDTPLVEGDIISIDIGAKFKGFHGDAARTFPVGKISDSDQKLIDVTRECFFEGIKGFKAGCDLKELSKRIQAHAEKHGYGVVRELVGHGVGANLHEDPQIPNYDSAFEKSLIIPKNACLAVEPMINAGTKEVAILDNDWTIITQDGKKSAHYENTILITETGVEILTL